MHAAPGAAVIGPRRAAQDAAPDAGLASSDGGGEHGCRALDGALCRSRGDDPRRRPLGAIRRVAALARVIKLSKMVPLGYIPLNRKSISGKLLEESFAKHVADNNERSEANAEFEGLSAMMGSLTDLSFTHLSDAGSPRSRLSLGSSRIRDAVQLVRRDAPPSAHHAQKSDECVQQGQARRGRQGR